METLLNTFRTRLDDTETAYIRGIHDEIEWDSRLVSVIGARGVGKSTLMLQHIKQFEDIDRTLYVSADDLYFTQHTLIDLAGQFYRQGGKALYIDEIHKYAGWSTEIKNIYDTYSRLKVGYTGSSILEIEKGGADLSRRKLEYMLPGLSFREYIALSQGIRLPRHTLNQILENNIEFPYDRIRPVALFKEYLKAGFYPYYKEKGYYLRLQNIISQVLENDIPLFVGMSATTAYKLKKLLYIIAQSVPFKPNFSKISRDLDLNRNLVSDLIVYLEKAQLISVLRDDTHGISALGKVDRIYLDNPNMAYALSDSIPEIGNVRETAFLSMVRPAEQVRSPSAGDFRIGQYTFEVGGRNKGQRQIESIDNAYVIKDDIEYGYLNVRPLWTFGLIR